MYYFIKGPKGLLIFIEIFFIFAEAKKINL